MFFELMGKTRVSTVSVTPGEKHQPEGWEGEGEGREEGGRSCLPG